MRGTKAKKIRREIFGDDAHRNTKYSTDRGNPLKAGQTIYCTGKRAAYQRAKRNG
ncbi:hypothetical protein KAR91_77120 [Candidatus Pacearchaeota archaeon]|nr:hypothetical protein [Candidatus Pacearchaeota archaeon]